MAWHILRTQVKGRASGYEDDLQTQRRSSCRQLTRGGAASAWGLDGRLTIERIQIFWDMMIYQGNTEPSSSRISMSSVVQDVDVTVSQDASI
jgi:hypothetical protein